MKKRSAISNPVPSKAQLGQGKSISPLRVVSKEKKILSPKEKEFVRLAATFIVNKIVDTNHEESH